MIRVLITGLNGLIGWNLFCYGSERYDTYGTYRKYHSRFEDKKVFSLDQHSPEAIEALIRQTNPDYLIHGWGMCDLDLCEINPEMAFNINVLGTKNILKACRNSKTIRKFIYISTDHVFNGDRGHYVETDEACPKDVFGKTKREAEQLVENSGMPYLIIRPGLVIGNSLQGRKGPKDFLLYRIRRNKPIHYFTDEWRTPVQAEELAARTFAMILSESQGIVHIAGQEIYSRYELAKKIASDHALSTENILPRTRAEDVWAHIRPKHLTLASNII